ncbi:MAG TPA: lantibiotic dehydratase, partial [Kribbellaceae bacterium]|nr:lantibiotic dehydratase [Kribbellaceae bacterium]
MWYDGLLRTTGFPVAGLDRLADPHCAAAADAHLRGTLTLDEFHSQFARTLRECSEQVNQIAADPRFREAIIWQNPGVVALLDSLMRGDSSTPPDRRRRYREKQLARFWQRYCAKTETIGFFGPSTEIRIDPNTLRVSAVPGAGFLRRREVFLEPWALTAYGVKLAEDADLKSWFPPTPMPHHVREGRCLRRPDLPNLTLTAEEAAALAVCDGRRPAALIVASLVADASLEVTTVGDGFRLLVDMARRGLLKWDANLPLGPQTAAVLDERIAAIGDDGLRRRAGAGLQRLRESAAAVAAAAGDPPALAAALATLDQVFTRVTGREPRRRPGESYAGRGVCYEDTERDLRVVVGRQFVDAVAPALAVVLQMARWVTSELARVYEGALLAVYDDLKDRRGPVSLADIWYPAVALFWGHDRKPVDDVLQTLATRWRTLLGLSAVPAATKRLTFTSTELVGPVAELFRAERPGWSLARIHNPDLQVCAASTDAMNDGDFLVVLSELHTAYATLGNHAASWFRPKPGRLQAFALQDYAQPRVVPLFPIIFSKSPGRLVQVEEAPSDWQLGFTRSKYVDPPRLVPAGAVQVFRSGDRLVGKLPGGRVLPLIEFFAIPLS